MSNTKYESYLSYVSGESYLYEKDVTGYNSLPKLLHMIKNKFKTIKDAVGLNYMEISSDFRKLESPEIELLLKPDYFYQISGEVDGKITLPKYTHVDANTIGELKICFTCGDNCTLSEGDNSIIWKNGIIPGCLKGCTYIIKLIGYNGITNLFGEFEEYGDQPLEIGQYHIDVIYNADGDDKIRVINNSWLKKNGANYVDTLYYCQNYTGNDIDNEYQVIHIDSLITNNELPIVETSRLLIKLKPGSGVSLDDLMNGISFDKFHITMKNSEITSMKRMLIGNASCSRASSIILDIEDGFNGGNHDEGNCDGLFQYRKMSKNPTFRFSYKNNEGVLYGIDFNSLSSMNDLFNGCIDENNVEEFFNNKIEIESGCYSFRGLYQTCDFSNINLIDDNGECKLLKGMKISQKTSDVEINIDLSNMFSGTKFSLGDESAFFNNFNNFLNISSWSNFDYTLSMGECFAESDLSDFKQLSMTGNYLNPDDNEWSKFKYVDLNGMFKGCRKLKTIPIINIITNNFNCSEIFADLNGENAKQIEWKNLTEWNFGAVPQDDTNTDIIVTFENMFNNTDIYADEIHLGNSDNSLRLDMKNGNINFYQMFKNATSKRSDFDVYINFYTGEYSSNIDYVDSHNIGYMFDENYNGDVTVKGSNSILFNAIDRCVKEGYYPNLRLSSN